MSFEAEWRGFYGTIVPFGSAMREAGTRHWQRFHSLPESKRYPENEAEQAELLHRANAVAAAVLGEGASCWLVRAVCSSSGEPQPDRCLVHLHGEVLNLEPAGHYIDPAADEEEQDGGVWGAFSHLTTWRAGAFDELIAAVADDTVGPTLWVARESGAVFAPYDGGMDLFLPHPKQRLFLRKRYAAWLSAYPEDL